MKKPMKLSALLVAAALSVGSLSGIASSASAAPAQLSSSTHSTAGQWKAEHFTHDLKLNLASGTFSNLPKMKKVKVNVRVSDSRGKVLKKFSKTVRVKKVGKTYRTVGSSARVRFNAGVKSKTVRVDMTVAGKTWSRSIRNVVKVSSSKTTVAKIYGGGKAKVSYMK